MSNMPEYHQSTLNMFLKCPRQYMFRYLMGLLQPPKAALTVGSAVDTAVTFNLEQKITTQEDLDIKEVLDVFSTDFEQRRRETDWDGEDPGELKDKGAQMVSTYHNEAAPFIQPVSIQESFRAEVESGYAIAGTFDVVDSEGFIRDTKTSKMEYPSDAVQSEVQPAIYSWGYEQKHGKKPAGFTYDVVTKHKQPRYQKVEGKVSDAQIARTFESIEIMHAQIKRGEFQYAPSGAWWCSKDWCGYWGLCKGSK